MSEEQTVTFNLELNVERALSNVRQLESVFFRALSLAQRLGLPEDIEQGIQKVQRMVMMLRLLHTTMIMVEAATPYGWAMALISVAGVSITAAEMTHEVMGEIQGH